MINYQGLDVFNLKKLSDKAGVGYFKLYNRMINATDAPLNSNDQTKLANAILKQLAPLLNNMGFTISITKKTTS